MALITLTSQGVVRAGVPVGEAFFEDARQRLLAAGFVATTWVDYVIHPTRYYVDIKKDKLIVNGQHGRLFTTKKIQRVVDLIAGQ